MVVGDHYGLLANGVTSVLCRCSVRACGVGRTELEAGFLL